MMQSLFELHWRKSALRPMREPSHVLSILPIVIFSALIEGPDCQNLCKIVLLTLNVCNLMTSRF